LIQVANAGYARFWVEIVFGKWVFPEIKTDFNVLEPKIVECAERQFGCKFIQACRWD